MSLRSPLAVLPVLRTTLAVLLITVAELAVLLITLLATRHFFSFSSPLSFLNKPFVISPNS